MCLSEPFAQNAEIKLSQNQKFVRLVRADSKTQNNHLQSMSDLLAKLNLHCQKDGDSCGASGSEALLKLHGLIGEGKFPLQDLDAAQPRGFESKPFLAIHKIMATDALYDISDAVDLIEKEANQDRFPLVSVPVAAIGNDIVFHVYLCGLHNGELVLIDPVPLGGHIQNRGKVGLATEFHTQIQKFPIRLTIHVLTYRNEN